jgi:hypothetical protein
MFSISKIFGYELSKTDLESKSLEYKLEDTSLENLEEDTNSDFEGESELENDVFLGILLYENTNIKFYVTQAKKFVKNIQIWAGQRPLNNEHIKCLARQFTKQEHVIGTFKVVRCSEGKIRLLDGQHRIVAIKEILKIQPDFNCDIFIELYETDRLESNKTLSLFQKANNVLNVNPEDMPNKNSLSIVDKLSSRFKLIFKDVEEGKKCIRPFIDKKKLFEKLKRAFQDHDINEDCLYERILEYNEINKRTRLDTIDLSKFSIDKCKISGCYLGFDKDCIWLDEILSIY